MKGHAKLPGPANRKGADLTSIVKQLAQLIPASAERGMVQITLIQKNRRESWSIVLDHNPRVVTSEQSATPDLEIITSPQTFLGIIGGTLSPIAAFQDGRLRIRGDLRVWQVDSAGRRGLGHHLCLLSRRPIRAAGRGTRTGFPEGPSGPFWRASRSLAIGSTAGNGWPPWSPRSKPRPKQSGARREFRSPASEPFSSKTLTPSRTGPRIGWGYAAEVTPRRFSLPLSPCPVSFGNPF